MKDTIFIEGLGLCKVTTVNKVNADGINEPYDIYEPIVEYTKGNSIKPGPIGQTIKPTNAQW